MKHKKYILIVALFISLIGYSQNPITGVVTDQDKQPLPGVSVLLKGTRTGTMTDFDGNFSISTKETDVLLISMTGMVPKHITVGNQTSFEIVLKPNVSQLEEVVVIGYGSVVKKDLTGSISTIHSKELETPVVAKFDEALAGRIAGVNVTSNEGTPGAAQKIVIRGGNSITGSNDPLYVINGLPLTDFDPATIATTDIETFTVLKDASATAIYGSRGANGVIVITTKTGKSNSKSEVTINLSTSLQQITNTLDVMGPYEYVKNLETQAIAKDGYQFLPNQGNPNRSNLNSFQRRWVDPELYRDVEGRDFQDEAFNLAPMTRGNISIRGGDDKTNMSFSTGFVDQEGVLITTGYKNFNTNITINHKLSNKVDLWAGMNYSKSNRIGSKLTDGPGRQFLKSLVTFAPVDPLIFSPGEVPGNGGYIPGVNDNEYAELFDPIENIRGTKREDKSHNIRVNTTLTWKINNDFKFKTTNGFNTNIGNEQIFWSENTARAQKTEEGISAQINGYERGTFSTSNTLQYSKSKNRTYLWALVGTEYVHNTNWSDRFGNNNLPTDAFGIHNIDIATRPTMARTDFRENALLSFFGRVNYNLGGNKYLFTATYRADGSSKFQGENRWGHFPSFSGAWQIAKENFMSNVKIVNSLKVRAGWGLTGNNGVGDYSSINQYGIEIWNPYIFGADEAYQPGAVQTTFAVPDLRWETTAQTNIGVDFSMVSSRLSGTIDYYDKKTEDLLLWGDMSLSSGFRAVPQNVGSVSNKGFELTLSGLIIDTKDFTWNSSINISTNKNKIIGLNDGQQFIKSDPRIQWNAEYYYISEVGKPVGMMYGLEYDGLYQAEDFIYDPVGSPNAPYILKEGIPANPHLSGPGTTKHVDQNGDGIIDQEDRVVIGNPYPDHFGGFSNDFKYKNFDLGILLRWSYGQDVFNANNSLWGFPDSQTAKNGFSTIANAWTPWNTESDVSAHNANGAATFPRPGYAMDSRYVEDGSYLRLQTVTLGYNIPIPKSSGFKNLRLSLSGQNLYTWTNYSGFDPEVNTRGNTMPNMDFSAYPKSRTYSFSVQAKF